MIKNEFLLLVAVLSSFALGLWGCSKPATNPASNQPARVEFSEISPAQAKKILDNQGVTFLDVREQNEYDEGHIPGIKLIPVGQLANRLAELNKDEEFIVVCRSGRRSAQASQILVDNGFTKVSNMTGGMLKWTYEVEK
ncbi:MAG: rhodanese-like domain-containing protein [Thermincolia bacterium]